MAKKNAPSEGGKRSRSSADYRERYRLAGGNGDASPPVERIFIAFPQEGVHSAPLATVDREFLTRYGLPRLWSAHGFFGWLRVADISDRLLNPLASVLPSSVTGEELILAEIGPEGAKGPAYMTIDPSDGSIWVHQKSAPKTTFVNADLNAFGLCLCEFRQFTNELVQGITQTMKYDDRVAQKLAKRCIEACQAIDPACVEPSAWWPRLIDAELAYWDETREVPEFIRREEKPSRRKPDKRTIEAVIQEVIDPDSWYYACPPLTDQMVRNAEKTLGYKLPRTYLKLLRVSNGASLRKSTLPTTEATSWSDDHVDIDAILGIGGEKGIDRKAGGSRTMIEEWGYPDIGVVIGATPSGGHTGVMLDYSECGPKGEPRVIWVEAPEVGGEEAWWIVIAPDFESMLRGLRDSDEE